MSKKEYKVGDKVRIRSDLELGEVFHNYNVNKDMQQNIGNIFTIKEVSGSGNLMCFEEINHIWTPEMLDPTFVDEPEPIEFRVGDICEAFGLECVVTYISSGLLYNFVSVSFKAQLGQIIETQHFTVDGKIRDWHKTPSLKLIRRAEVKKPVVYEYQYVYTTARGAHYLSNYYINKEEMKNSINYKGEKNYSLDEIKSAKRLARSKKIRGEG